MHFLKISMNKKRAQGLSLNMIIVAAIGLIVLIIIAVIFREHIVSYSKGYKETADKAIESAEGERCVSLFSTTTRKCSENAPDEGWKEITLEKDKWTDCKENEKCWEKIKEKSER